MFTTPRTNLFVDPHIYFLVEILFCASIATQNFRRAQYLIFQATDSLPSSHYPNNKTNQHVNRLLIAMTTTINKYDWLILIVSCFNQNPFTCLHHCLADVDVKRHSLISSVELHWVVKRINQFLCSNVNVQENIGMPLQKGFADDYIISFNSQG